MIQQGRVHLKSITPLYYFIHFKTQNSICSKDEYMNEYLKEPMTCYIANSYVILINLALDFFHGLMYDTY